MKYSLWSLIIVVLAIGLYLGGFYFFREQGEIIRDAYCIDWASATIIQYMDDNDDRYPTEWNDLRQPFEKISDKSFTFEEIQSRVAIDFSATPLDMDRNAMRPLVSLKSGRSMSGGSPEPNERIRVRIAQSKPAA